jgi:hypothetical protein
LIGCAPCRLPCCRRELARRSGHKWQCGSSFSIVCLDPSCRKRCLIRARVEFGMCSLCVVPSPHF